MNIKLIALFFFTSSLSCLGMNSPASKLWQEISKRRCSPDLQKRFEEALQKNGMAWDIGRAYSILGVSDYFFKDQQDRLIGAKLYNEVIEKKQLNLLFVPFKCACSFNNNTWNWIAAKKVDNFSDKPFNLEHVKQLSTLVLKTWAWDLHEGNIKPTTDGRVAILDTKLCRFQENKSDRLRGLFRLVQCPMTDEAKEYLNSAIEREKDNIEITKWFAEKLIKEGATDTLKAYKESRTRSYTEYN